MLVRIALLFSLLFAAPAAAHGPERWESGPDAPLPRQEAAFAALGDSLYLAGGFEEGGAESARQDVYDIGARAWSIAPPMPEPAHHISAAGLGGRVFYVGGLQTLGFVPTGRMWAYDPATRLWSLKAGLPAGRERGAGAVAVHDGRIVYVGGARVVADGSGPPRRVAVAMVDMYDPATDRWTALPDMPSARDHLAAAVVGHKLYAVGGRALRMDMPVAATEVLDLKKLEWRGGLAPIPSPRGGLAAGVVGDEIVTVGGENPLPGGPTPLDVRVHDDVESYDPEKDRWRTRTRIPLARTGIQGAVHEGHLYVASGGVGKQVLTTASLAVFLPGPAGGGGG